MDILVPSNVLFVCHPQTTVEPEGHVNLGEGCLCSADLKKAATCDAVLSELHQGWNGGSNYMEVSPKKRVPQGP